jgi:hypothetical protein
MHETAFARLGGTPRVLILDNLREGVLKPGIYDPAINPLYRDRLAHYQAIAVPYPASRRCFSASAMRGRRL